MNDLGSALAHTTRRGMDLPLGFEKPRVFGGSYRDSPEVLTNNLTIRLEDGINRRCHIDLPIADFSVPAPGFEQRVRRAVELSLFAAARGEEVFVGCMGGTGRTGMILVLMLRELGFEGPEAIAYVRKHYKPGAVETHAQERYVAEYECGLTALGRVRLHATRTACEALDWWGGFFRRFQL